MSEWISVNDRLPEESASTPVNIVWMNTDPAPYYADIKNKPFVGTAYYFNGKWWWFSQVCDDYLAEYGRSDADEVEEGIVITHWMPIAAPDLVTMELYIRRTDGLLYQQPKADAGIADMA